MSTIEVSRGSLREPKTKPLAGQVAIVTGASRGIGADIALDLAAAGAVAIVNFKERERDAVSVCNRIVEAGGSGSAYQADVTNRRQVQSMVDRLVQAYGKIDILVNNSGILRDRSFKNMSGAEWDAVLETNLTGVFNACGAVVPHMIDSRGGCIINVSSVIGQTGNFGQANYSAAKAGVIGFSRSLALELARYGIRVNAIAPGFVDTAMWQSIPPEVQQKILEKIPLGRVAFPEEIAEGVRYLTLAKYVTGQTLNVNGGLYLG